MNKHLAHDSNNTTQSAEKTIKELQNLEFQKRLELENEIEQKQRRSSILLMVWAGITAVVTYAITERDGVAKESTIGLATISVILAAVSIKIIVDFLFNNRERVKKQLFNTSKQNKNSQRHRDHMPS